MDRALWAVIGAAIFSAAFITLTYWLRRRRQNRLGEQRLAQAVAANVHLPQSLHPVINTDICIGSLNCIRTCPEGDILGVVDGHPQLVAAANCLGHGKCAAECPVGAIKLVFGTAERGVDLPEVDPFFESSRPGVHVVGELGGMGLIKNAFEQGLQVTGHLGRQLGRNKGRPGTDVAIVGSGPAGLATALGCRQAGLSFRILEQTSLGGAIAHYPRQKLIMTEPIRLPLVGKIGKRAISKEELLRLWKAMAQKGQLHVEEGVQVTGIEGHDGQFKVKTNQGHLQARKVVLATGRRGTPRKLGVPGEQLSKVAYGLVDPEQYQGRRVLVVGSGDSAAEAAIQLGEQTDALVVLSFRSPALTRCREANRRKVEALAQRKRVQILPASQVKAIHADHVELAFRGQSVKVANDYVVACLGGELPLELLGKCGVKLTRHYGTSREEVRVSAAHRAPAATAPEDRQRRLGWTLFWVGLLIVAGLYAVGWNYYPLTHAERLRSPLNRWLRPAGPWGHGVGIAATAVMMGNFLYAVRKRSRLMRGWGDIRSWLTFHMFIGVLAPTVIAFHAAFQSRNVLATATSASLAVVVLTGLAGRYLFRSVPNQGGWDAQITQLTQRWEDTKIRLNPLLAPATPSPELDSMVEEATVVMDLTGMASLIRTGPIDQLRSYRQLRRTRGLFRKDEEYRAFAGTYREAARLKRQIATYRALNRLVPVWRVLHVSLSLFLVLLIAAHIGVSLYLGYALNGGP